MVMKTLSLHLPSFVLFISVVFLALPNQAVAAVGDILFEDDFNDGDDIGWQKIHEKGPVDTSTMWTIIDGKYGMNITTKDTAGNSITGSSSWTDYAYELDMNPIQAVDKNFIFRYSESLGYIRFYEIHVYRNEVNLSRTTGLINGSRQIAFYPISNGSTYRWRVELLNNNIKVFIKLIGDAEYTKLFDIDDGTPILDGKIGLRIGTGADSPSNVFFDNIKVYDLTPPTFPYFSQLDPLWSELKYDNINKTIGGVGCALTSAAMVLKYHGVDKVPWGTELVNLTPQTLQDWLNLDPNRWAKNGHVRWPSFTQLANALHASDSAFTKIEYQRYANDPNHPELIHQTAQALFDTTTHPLIFKFPESESSSGTHFVVATSYLTPDAGFHYPIYDPYDAEQTSFNSPPNTLKDIDFLYPTASDLSYIWLEHDPQLSLLLITPNNLRLGKDSNQQLYHEPPLSFSELEDPIVDDLDLTSTPVQASLWISAIKSPLPGTYTLTLTAPLPGWYSFSVNLYTQTGESVHQPVHVFLGPNIPQTYTFTFPATANPPLVPQPISFASLLELIRSGYQANYYTGIVRNRLLIQVQAAELVNRFNLKLSLKRLHSIQDLITKYAKKNQINHNFATLLNQQIDLLIASLQS